MPPSITEVTSPKTLPRSAAVWPGDDQYGHVSTGTPTARSALAPHSANAEVTPQGRPAMSSVAEVHGSRPTAPATSGHGPRSQRARRGAGSRHHQLAEAAPLDDDRRHEDGAEDREAHRQRADRSVDCARATSAGRRAATSRTPNARSPTTEPAMNASSVTTIRVLPPPTLKSVPDAQPPPSCMPTPKMKAPMTTGRPGGCTRPVEPHAERFALRQQREERRAGDGEHQHLRAHAFAAAVGDEAPATPT